VRFGYYLNENDAVCVLIAICDENDFFLITGLKKNTQISDISCNTARKLDSLCGPRGKYYRKKYTKKNK
jgi:hypothetical protein